MVGQERIAVMAKSALGGDGGDGGDVSTLRGKLSVRYRSVNEETPGDSFHGASETSQPFPPSPPGDAFDLQEERLAIQREATYATCQTIPQAQMVTGLIRASRWPR